MSVCITRTTTWNLPGPSGTRDCIDIGPVHTYPEIFVSANFFMRIQKYLRPHVAYTNRIRPSTRIRFVSGQIEQFTNLASKHVQEWIEGGHDVKENIPTLIHMSLPEKASHSTKRARGPNPNEERDNEGRQSKDVTPEDNDKENRKRKPRGETNNSQAKKVKKTSHNKTATKSSNEILKPTNPKTAEY